MPTGTTRWRPTSPRTRSCRRCRAPLLRLLEEAASVVPQELVLRRRLEALPGEDVRHRIGELAFRMGIVRGVHQHIISQKAGDALEHVLALVALDRAEEAAALEVVLGMVFQLCAAADIFVLLVHA